MRQCYFHCRGVAVALVADPATHEWTRRRCKPFLEETDVWPGAPPWTVYAGTSPQGSSGWSTFSRRSSNGEACVFKVDLAARKVLVDLPPGAWRSLFTLRMIRNVLRWELFHRGAVFLHAGCIARDGKGIALIGGSKSGKSTIALDLLRQGGWEYVTDDELTVFLEADGRVKGLGWPGAHRVRRNTLGLFPELLSKIESFAHPANQLPSERASETGWLRIFPEELRSIYGCSVATEVQLVAVMRLSWDTSPSIRQLDSASVAASLHSAWDILPERRPGYRPNTTKLLDNDWGRQVFDHFFLLGFGLPDLSRVEGNLRRIEQSLRGFSVAHDSHIDDAKCRNAGGL